ncbi:endoglucanase 12-like [Zingiber officinale]|uniref:endoglucanase 12-like n=1 Tax=Zingiber officinale TaxID=94328 RepID=UPI001C4C7348|nr:endoglucanase 12-like [Zingiber officinale]
MHYSNRWGGSFEIQHDAPAEDQQSSNMQFDPPTPRRRKELVETQLGWLLSQRQYRKKNKENCAEFCVSVCKMKCLRRVLLAALIAIVVTGISMIVVRRMRMTNREEPAPKTDNYTVALSVALQFFNAQKSGHLTKSNALPWRGDSGLQDGSELSDLKGGLVGGYYDSGNNMKFHFPMAFSMTLLSWSVAEYGPKYKAIGEYNHIKDIIKWGIDYLLLTFNSSAPSISKMYSQVGISQRNSTSPDDGYCWQRPEDINYPRPVQTSTSAPDLAGEVAAALAAASLVFKEENAYSKRLVHAAKTAYRFAQETVNKAPYSTGNQMIAQFYNSTGYWDEYIWASAWLFYATGNYSYLAFVTDPNIYKNANADLKKPGFRVFSWDNKLPGAILLLSRLRIFLNPGYPLEDMLGRFHADTSKNMCSYLRQFRVFNWTKGGLIQLNHGKPRQLQYAANAAFLASVYADYMKESRVPGWHCGSFYFNISSLRSFAASQVNYILGANPKNISYLVGFGNKFPKNVHHRGASTPHDGHKYPCTGGWKWRDSEAPNPNVITGAMVSGPDKYDHFFDTRTDGDYTEPTLAGNAGLVAALVALAKSNGSEGIDKNAIFSSVQPFFLNSPPPSAWKP